MSTDWCRGLFVSYIRDGQVTHLWLDYQCLKGHLCDLFSFQVLLAVGLPRDATVSDIIHDGLWAFPLNSLKLQQIWDSIRIYPYSGVPNHLVWKCHSFLVGFQLTLDGICFTLREMLLQCTICYGSRNTFHDTFLFFVSPL